MRAETAFSAALLLLLCSAVWTYQAVEYDEEEFELPPGMQEQLQRQADAERAAAEAKQREAEAARAADESAQAAQAAHAAQAEQEEAAAETDPAVRPPFVTRVWEAMKKRDWTMEMYMLAFLAVYLVNWFIGKREIEKLVVKWTLMYAGLLKAEFSNVGHGRALVRQESYETYSITATGRNNCIGLYAELQMKRRHDLLSVLYSLYTPEKDFLVIDIPLDETMENVVFALLHSRAKTAFLDVNTDVKSYCKVYSTGNKVPSKYIFFAENHEIFDGLFDPFVLRVINDNSDLIHEIHATDSHSQYQIQQVLHFKIEIPSKLERHAEILEMVFYLIDSLSRFRLSRPSKEKARQTRKKVLQEKQKEKHVERQEKAQQRRLEKTRKIKEKLADSPEELEKFEEREKMRKLKKQAKQKMAVMMA